MTQELNLTDKAFKAICDTIYDHTGIHLDEGKKDMVRSRLARLLRKHNFTSYSEYLDYVLKDPASDHFSEFIDRISTNKTSFFREQHHFDYLTNKIIPELAKKQSGNKRIRIWSAGCSTGEESYSLAITFAQNLPNYLQEDVRILASDISTKVLRIASVGQYSEDQIESLLPAVRKEFFDVRNRQGAKIYAIKPSLRKMLIFKQINLIGPWPISTKLDVIFCRNVMIYFDKETQQKLINRFEELLKPGGTLCIGHSESLSSIKHNLKYIEPTIYQR